ncbi:hypothetical protein ABZ434_32360 [Streptomyces sp. NPDC005761]|uniref:hypothetical protein n=1 Tax=Streptomyces sp. NPDC005761 TaxID=3157066 RepID=UPI0034085252
MKGLVGRRSWQGAGRPLGCRGIALGPHKAWRAGRWDTIGLGEITGRALIEHENGADSGVTSQGVSYLGAALPRELSELETSPQQSSRGR